MTTHRIFIPTKLNLLNTLHCINILKDLPIADEYIFDFKNLCFSEPFGLLAISSELRQCIEKHHCSKFYAENVKDRDYEGHMGFFKSCGIEHGKLPGEVSGNLHYLPINIKSVEKTKMRAFETCQELGDVIEAEAKQIACVLAQDIDTELVEILSYSIREIIRNVVEHSESSQYGYCAQYWPKLNTVEFSLLDMGIGIRKSLSRNPLLTLVNDIDALKLCLIPGVSGVTYKGKKNITKSHWMNTGFGLYMTHRICGNGGSFFLVSGNSAILLNQRRRYYLPANFNGTALRLRLKLNRNLSISNVLEKYRKEGYDIAKQFNEEAVLDANAASQVLSKDFYLKAIYKNLP